MHQRLTASKFFRGIFLLFVILNFTFPGTIQGADGLVTWTKTYTTSQVTTMLIDAAYGNGTFVAVGEKGIVLSSPTGSSWTSRNSGTAETLWSIAYGANKFVTVGSKGTIRASSNGTAWSYCNSGTTAIGFFNVIYSGTQFVAVGDQGYIATSPDGVSWTQRFSGVSDTVFAVAYGKGIYVAGTDNGKILSSTDAINWTHRNPGAPFNWVLDIAYGNGRFVAVGAGGDIRTSSDGATWTKRSAGTTIWFNGVAFGSDKFVIADESGKIHYSSTGSSWTTVTPSAYVPFMGIGYGSGNSTFVAVGQGGILQSGTVSTTPSNITISGTVTDGTNPVSGVTLTFSHNGETVSTNSSGFYSYSIPSGTSTSITPSKADYTFTPSNRTLNSPTSNQSNQNFTATANPGSSVSVSVTGPTDGETVSGSVLVEANAEATGSTVSRVDFYIDGQLAKQDSQSPYQYQWDTTGVENGSYSIKAKATDSDGNTGEDTVTVTVANTTEPPHITLNRDSLVFRAAAGRTQSGTQTVLVGNNGGGTLSWTAAAEESWLNVSPANGTAGERISITVNVDGLAVGSYTGTVQISDGNADNSPATVTVTLEIKARNADEAPFGTMELPEDGATVRGSIPVSGWVLDDIEVAGVTIYRETDNGNRFKIGDAVLVEGARDDVAASFTDYPYSYRAGWGYMLLSYGLPGGGYSGSFTITAVATDNSGNEFVLGSKTIVCDNANATKPFGALDTPAQGGEASGSEYRNWAWALTPQPNTIAADASTITVLIDGHPLPGNPTYNLPRKDIAGLFPDYNNSSGPAGLYTIDTTLFENGVHTISWTVTDDAGQREGIGSRFFTIYNPDSERNDRSSTNQSKATSKRNSRMSKLRRLFTSGSNQSRRGPHKEYSLPALKKSQAISKGMGQKDIPVITIKEGEPLKLNVFGFNGGQTTVTGVTLKGKKRDALPIGSCLNPFTGEFYWQPGPGFIGQYTLQFVKGKGKRSVETVKIEITPKF